MANVTQPTVSKTRISEDSSFVEQKTPNGQTVPAYVVEVPDDYVFGVERGTMFAPEFRDSSGQKLDGSTRVIVQVADRRGNVVSDAILMDIRLSELDYTNMRSDEDFIRELSDTAVLDEREELHIYVVEPGSSNFDHSASNLTIGDATSNLSGAVKTVRREDIGEDYRMALENKER